VVGKLLFRPFFRWIGQLQSQELFTATTLLIVLGSALITQMGGLSLALGAFIAGLLVAETEYRLQVETDIRPFQGLLMGLFFMTIGMAVDISFLLKNLPLIVGLTIALLILKGLIVWGLARLFGFRKSCAVNSGAYLCQGSEFAFALFVLADANGVIPHHIAQTLLMIVAVSMAVTPMIIGTIKNITDRLEKRHVSRMTRGSIKSETQDIERHMIIIGFGRVGRNICELLNTEEIHHYVAMDADSHNVTEGRKEGFPVYFGHADRIELLKSLGIDRAKMVIVTLGQRAAATAAVRTIRRTFPDMYIIARAQDRFHAKELQQAGANAALAEAFESSLLIGEAILAKNDVADHEIQRVLGEFRANVHPH